MTTDACLVCAAFGSPTPRQPRAGYTCPECLLTMRRHLDDLPELYLWAARELTPGASTGERGSERSIGLRVGALDLRWGGEVIAVLVSWALDFRETFALVTWVEPFGPSTDPTGATLLEVVRFLQAHLARASESHPGIDVFAKELASLHHQAEAAARTRPRQAWVVSCPADQGERSCGQRLRVTGEDFGGWVQCAGCGTTWDVMRLLHVVVSDSASTLWLPADELALLYRISERTLRRWAEAGQVGRSHGRYDVASVRARALEGMLRSEA